MTPRNGLEISFDPAIHLGGALVRWQAVALAGVILLALWLFGRELRRRLGSVPPGDVAWVLLAAIPGAVVGGRLVHGIVYWEGYADNPGSLLDLGVGSLSLAGAVVGGLLTAAYLCRILGYRIGDWADASAIPLLLLVGGGKLAMVLGGAGQGAPLDNPFSIAFPGGGPWWSADPALPSWPAQVMEGAWALLGMVVMTHLRGRLETRGRAGGGLLLLATLAWWLAGRSLIAIGWRDERRLGPLGGEGLIAVALTLVVLAILAWRLTRRRPEPRLRQAAGLAR